MNVVLFLLTKFHITMTANNKIESHQYKKIHCFLKIWTTQKASRSKTPAVRGLLVYVQSRHVRIEYV